MCEFLAPGGATGIHAQANPHADYAFMYRGADTSAWGFTIKADASIVKHD
jgi:hypothetical protein